MKKITLILLLTTSLGYSQTLVKTYYDPLYKTKLKEVYQVKKNTPTVNGYYKSYDKFGYLLVHRNYINNSQNGKSTTYYGSAEASINYGGKNCLGKISGVYNYKNDKLDGIQIKYNYSEKGERYLHKKETYSNGTMTNFIEYFPNNQEKKVIKTGKCFEYYENGVKSAEYTSNKNGELQGKYTAWYNSGKLEITGNFLNNQKNGEWIEYFENGKIKNKEIYKLGNKLLNENEKIEKEKKLKKEKDFFESERKRLYKKDNNISELNNSFKYANQAVNYDYEYSTEKRILYNKYNELINFLDTDSKNKEISEKIKYVKIKIRLAEKMKILFNKNTKLLEEKISKTENEESLINLILKK